MRKNRSMIAGTRVIARTAAIIIEKFFVKASGLNNLPSWYWRAKIGIKETAITRSEKKLGPPTSFTASMITCFAGPGRPSACQCSNFLWVCSTTTIAASTIAPIAMAIPPRDMMFAVKPIACIGMNARTTAIGIVRIGMIALGGCQRKMRMTILTMSNSSRSV